MKDIRCTGHFRGKPCRKLLMKVESKEAIVEIICPKCSKKNKIEVEH